MVSKMIWSDELSASLDQAGAVVVFHRIELSRTQQLALSVADKVASMVEQNEKALDLKLGGGTGWTDRGEANKGEKRGEQTQERRGRGERRGISSTRGMFQFLLMHLFLFHCVIGTRGRGGRFAQGLGNQMGNVLQQR
jgi:translation initiation factor 3 subunit C